MEPGEICENFKAPPHPKGIRLEGQRVFLEPLGCAQHARKLFEANSHDIEGKNWIYLKIGPFDTFEEYSAWVRSVEDREDQVFFAIIRKSDSRPVGVASYLRINEKDGTIEVGNLNYSPLLQRTTEATEAMYLMMSWAFESGFRRYEWKCNALNVKSRKAAQRLGFSFEGVFRQMEISKGRNRDTAWFAIIDKEWPDLQACYKTYLSEENYDENNRPRTSLSSLTRPLLFNKDELDFFNKNNDLI